MMTPTRLTKFPLRPNFRETVKNFDSFAIVALSQSRRDERGTRERNAPAEVQIGRRKRDIDFGKGTFAISGPDDSGKSGRVLQKAIDWCKCVVGFRFRIFQLRIKRRDHSAKTLTQVGSCVQFL
jgi:hypothetical protein